MSGKRVGGSIAVAGTVCCIVALLIPYWTQFTIVSPPPNDLAFTSQKSIEAKITDFSVIDWGSLPCIIGVTVAIRFNATVQNIGRENLTDLKVSLELLSNDTAKLLDECWYSNYNLTVNSGETDSLEIDYFVDLNTAGAMHSSHQNFSVVLTSNGTVLDKRTLF